MALAFNATGPSQIAKRAKRPERWKREMEIGPKRKLETRKETVDSPKKRKQYSKRQKGNYFSENSLRKERKTLRKVYETFQGTSTWTTAATRRRVLQAEIHVAFVLIERRLEIGQEGLEAVHLIEARGVVLHARLRGFHFAFAPANLDLFEEVKGLPVLLDALHITIPQGTLQGFFAPAGSAQHQGLRHAFRLFMTNEL